jgi:hypothetical protein
VPTKLRKHFELHHILKGFQKRIRQSFGKKLRLKKDRHFPLQQSCSVSQNERKNLQESTVGGEGDTTGYNRGDREGGLTGAVSRKNS